LRQVPGTESTYYRAIGSAEALMAKAQTLGQSWMKGVASEVVKKILLPMAGRNRTDFVRLWPATGVKRWLDMAPDTAGIQ
jgi:hypothetical protein